VTTRAPLEVAIVCYPGAQATCVHGLTDLFTYADHFARLHAAGSAVSVPCPATAGDQPLIRATHWRERADGSLACDSGGEGSACALVIVPACQLGPPEPDRLAGIATWVARRHAAGAVVAAVCGGVFLLAESGLLAGRRATTHWMFAAELRRRFPDLKVEAERLVIDDGDIVTAGGVLAWADMGLTLVERLLGRTVMVSTARFMLMDPSGREQRFYGQFIPPLNHGDRAIVSIQHWLHANSTTPCSIASLAARAGLGSRTFHRRFVKATGMKPGEYHQQLRITRGRELLEFTRDTVEQISITAGYEDARGFRRTFKRVVGLSPAEYRRRFRRVESPRQAS
jgi:transcriptional regulator GlxA family with amidase domain